VKEIELKYRRKTSFWSQYQSILKKQAAREAKAEKQSK